MNRTLKKRGSIREEREKHKRKSPFPLIDWENIMGLIEWISCPTN